MTNHKVFRWIETGVVGLFVDNRCRFMYQKVQKEKIRPDTIGKHYGNVRIYRVGDFCNPNHPGTLVYGERAARALCLELHNLKELP